MIRSVLCGMALVGVITACGGTATRSGAGAPATAGPAPTAATPVGTAATAPVPPVTTAPGPTVTAAPGPTVTAAPVPAPSVVVRTAAGYGRLLVDGAGRTLYLFTADHGRTSACTDACAAAWPPLIVTGHPRAGHGLQGARLSLVRRAGGQLQLAYSGHPLYYYVGDRQAGQINCQDAEEYGGHWWLVGPDGGQNRSTPA